MASMTNKHFMRPMFVIFILLFGVVGYVVWQWSSSWRTDQWIVSIEKILSSYHHVNVRVPLGEADIYRDKETLVKVSVRFFDDYASRRVDTRKTDYYFTNGAPVYIKERVVRLSSLGDEVVDVEENRYFLTNGKLRQWWRDDEKRQETDSARITKREQELVQQWKELSNMLARRLAWTIIDSKPLGSFLPGKVFTNLGMSGEYGTFEEDGSLPISWGRDFVTRDTRPSSGAGSWRVEGETLTINGTTISDGSFRDFVFEKRDNVVIAYPRTGGFDIYIGPNTDVIYEFFNSETVTAPGVDL